MKNWQSKKLLPAY